MKEFFQRKLMVLAFAAVGTQPLWAGDQPRQVCAYDHVTVRSDFSAGRINACELDGATVKLTIEPEDEPPINPSPWYSFKVEPKGDQAITVDLVYKHAKHRYWPKVSRDGQNWFYLSAEAVKKLNDNVVRLSLGVQGAPLHVSAQELFPHSKHMAWMTQLAEETPLEMSVIGQSKAGRPIHKLEAPAGNGDRDYIVLIGRQHPPEVTGALALLTFAETVMGDSNLAKEFRTEFGIIIAPELNPDGVENGHWRHSLGDLDLNRDWTNFSQPETQAMRQQLERFKKDDRLWFFSDFHSTNRNVLYVQADDEETNPRGFLRAWTQEADKNEALYEYEYAERPLTDIPTSKTYVFKTFGVPAITYEVGDETERTAIAESARIFAEAMMMTLLDMKKEGK